MSKFLSTSVQKKQQPIDGDILEDVLSQLEKEFPSECKAQRAVEGHDRHPRDKALVPSDRFGE